MKTTLKSVLLAAGLGILVTTALGAMVDTSPIPAAAAKADKLAVPAAGKSGPVMVEQGDGNVSIVTRPETRF